MIELHSDPYVLKPRPSPETECDFRIHLNINWCRGVLFNVVALKNSIAIVEYDAILWSEDSLMFLEYKDSTSAYKALSSRRIQQMSSYARNIARGLGYRKFNFIVVVKNLEESTTKGGVKVIPLYELGNYEPEFVSSVTELEYLDKMIGKYTREGMESMASELKKLKTMMENEMN